MADQSTQLGAVEIAQLGARQNAPLTDDQQNFIRDLISKYDVNNLSAADHKSIREALKAEGIGPSRAVAQELSSLGVPPPGGPEGPPKGPPPPPPEEASEVEAVIQEILSNYDLENLSDQDRVALEAQLKEATAGTSIGQAFDALA